MHTSVNIVRRSAFALGAVAVACLLVACGSSSSSSSTSSSASAAASTGRGGFANRTKLVACLKQHGVSLPSRPAGAGAGTGGGASGTHRFGAGGGGFFGGAGGRAANPKFAAAFKACGANFGGHFSAASGAARKATITKFVTCVRQHGYNLPTPNLTGKGSVFPAKIETNAKFKTASRACASDLAVRPPGGAPPAA
jgi:hypothetical protein